MLKLETIDDLNRLIAEGIKESLTLDYKASPALGKGEKQRDELCKDVTAFANSAGGQIVYGVEEDKHVPTKIDDGADPAITKEWIEQVIDSRVQQCIEGLVITPIQLAKGLGFVITIRRPRRGRHTRPQISGTTSARTFSRLLWRIMKFGTRCAARRRLTCL